MFVNIQVPNGIMYFLLLNWNDSTGCRRASERKSAFLRFSPSTTTPMVGTVTSTSRQSHKPATEAPIRRFFLAINVFLSGSRKGSEDTKTVEDKTLSNSVYNNISRSKRKPNSISKKRGHRSKNDRDQQQLQRSKNIKFSGIYRGGFWGFEPPWNEWNV